MPARYWMRRSSDSLASALAMRALDAHGALQRIDDAAELDQQTVADGLDDPARVLLEHGVDHVLAMHPLAGDGSRLVGFHMPQ